jgi:hypothetical protein
MDAGRVAVNKKADFERRFKEAKARAKQFAGLDLRKGQELWGYV